MGKRMKTHLSSASRMSAAALLKAYKEDVERKRDLIRRANGAHDRLVLIVEALRRLQKDDVFTGLVEDEGLPTMPEKIHSRLTGHGSLSHG